MLSSDACIAMIGMCSAGSRKRWIKECVPRYRLTISPTTDLGAAMKIETADRPRHAGWSSRHRQPVMCLGSTMKLPSWEAFKCWYESHPGNENCEPISQFRPKYSLHEVRGEIDWKGRRWKMLGGCYR